MEDYLTKLKAQIESAEPATGGPARKRNGAEEVAGGYPFVIYTRLPAQLLREVRNAVDAAKAGGIYTYQSVSDVFRMALAAYFDGMRLSAQAQKTPKRATSFNIDAGLKEQYDHLPSRSRGEIIERAVRTYLKERF